MRLKSVYSVYREYFGYGKSDNPKVGRNYALAIEDSLEVMCEICKTGSLSPIQDYRERSKKSSFTLKFLNNAQSILMGLDEEDRQALQFVDAEIWIAPEELLRKSRMGTYVPVPYLINHSKHQIINLSFGHPEEIHNQLKVLKGMGIYFRIDVPWPSMYDSFVYWDLSNGKQTNAMISDVVPVSKESIVSVLNRLVPTRAVIFARKSS